MEQKLDCHSLLPEQVELEESVPEGVASLQPVFDRTLLCRLRIDHQQLDYYTHFVVDST